MKWHLVGLILGSTLLTAALFWPYSSHLTDALPNSVDPVFYAWNISHNVQSAAHGFKNLMDANIFYPEGNTIALSDTLFGQTVFLAPVLLLTRNPVFTENLYILGTFPIAAVSMFLLSRYLTGNTIASILSGLFFAFSYPRLSQIGHMPALSSQWLPLVFLYLIRWIREGKFKYLLLLFLWFLLSITSTMYFGIFLLPLSLILIAFELPGIPRPHIRGVLRQFLLIALPAAVIVTLALFPYIRLRAEYPGIRRSLEDAARLSAQPVDYMSVLPTSWLSDLHLPTNTNERVLYPTLILLVLGLCSLLVTGKNNRKTILGFSLISISALVLSLGPNIGDVKLPYYYLYKIYPLLESIRVPARFSIFVILGLSVCAAFTLSRFLKGTKSIPIALFIGFIFLTEVWQVNVPYVRIPLWKEAPEVYHVLEKEPDEAIIVELPLHPEWNGVRMENQLTLTYEEANENDVYALEAYRTYFSSFHRKRMINGYSGYFPNIYHDHSIVLDSFPSKDSLNMLRKQRVRYILIHEAQYVNVPYSDIKQKIREFPELKLVGQFGSDWLYTL